MLWTSQVLLLYVAHLDVWEVNTKIPVLSCKLIYFILNWTFITNFSIIPFCASSSIYMRNLMTNTQCIGIFNFKLKMHIKLWLTGISAHFCIHRVFIYAKCMLIPSSFVYTEINPVHFIFSFPWSSRSGIEVNLA